MKKIFLIVILIIEIEGFAQVKPIQQVLYYFMTKDSLIGVKTAAGKIIIKPRQGLYYFDKEFNKPIKEDLIYLDASEDDIREPHSIGLVYDRKGKLLFAPFMYDNGPDWYSEGLMRFVKNGKVGFANRAGEVVIDARYDFANQFNYGIASYCNGCVWTNKEEHSFVRGGEIGYVNYKGDSLILKPKRESEKDQQVDSGMFIKFQFTYSPMEQKIVDSLSTYPTISKSYFVNHYSKLDTNERRLRFEIVEKPSAFYSNYHIKAFVFTNAHGFYGDDVLDLNIFTDRNGKNYYLLDYNNRKVPLKRWLKDELIRAREFLKKHPEALYKF